MTTKLEPLSGITNGSNRLFTAPEAFLPGSTRLIWNGQVYQASDERHGFAETAANQITTTYAPRTGDELLLLYRINAGAASTGQHADGVQDLSELATITQAEREDRQIRLVEDENALYRFDVGATTGGIVPNDVDDGRWFPIGDQFVTFIGSPFHPQNTLP